MRVKWSPSMGTDNPDELRDSIEERLGHSVAPGVWNNLSPDWVSLGRRHGPGVLSDLVEEVRREERIYRAGLNSTRVGHPQLTVSQAIRRNPTELRRPESIRARILGEAISAVVRADSGFIAFRDIHLSGLTLSKDEASRLLLSPALRVLPRRRIVELGIPLLEHRARLKSSTDTLDHNRASVSRQELSISWSRRRSHVESVQWPQYRRILRLPKYLSSSGGRAMHSTTVLPGAFLDDARILADRIAARFDWQNSEALWFLMTQVVPQYDAQEAFIIPAQPPAQPDARIGITVCSWASAETVRRLFLQCQKRVLGRRKRQLSAKMLELFEFVEANRLPPPAHPNWPDLFRQWKGSKSSRRESPPRTRRQFRRAYLHVKRLLLGSP
jgi:hypothetical protein